MILANCPRCNEPVRFPEVELPGDTQARCPWCQEVFSAQDVAVQLPPLVDLFDGSGVPLEPAAAGVGIAASAGLVSATAIDEVGSVEEVTINTGVLDDEEPALEELDEDAFTDEASLGNDDVEELESAEPVQESGFVEFDQDDTFEEQQRDDGDSESSDVDPTSQTWDDNGEPTDYEVVSDEEASFVEDDEESEADDLPAHDFRIEEDGPISEDSYGVVPSQAVDLDSVVGGVAPMHVKSKGRGRHKRSSLRTLLGVALGPVLALPIAGLIFYVLGTDLGFWPLDGGRSQVSSRSAAPPMDLSHFDPPAANDVSASDLPEAIVPADSPTKDSTEALTNANESLPVAQDDQPTEAVAMDRSFWAPPELAGDSGPDDLNGAPPVGDDTEAVPVELPADLTPAPETNEVVEPKIEPKKKQTKEKKAATDNGTGSNEPRDRSESIDTLLSQSDREFSLTVKEASRQLKMIERLSDDPSVDKNSKSKWKAPFAQTYAAVAKVGDVKNFPSSENTAELLSALKASKLLDDLAAAAPQWLGYAKRTNEGVLLVGRPGSNENGPTLMLPSGLEVPIKADSLEIPKSGKLVALGQIEKESANVVVRVLAIEPAN